MTLGTSNSPQDTAALHLRVAEKFLTMNASGPGELEAAALHCERALDLLRVAVARARMGTVSTTGG